MLHRLSRLLRTFTFRLALVYVGLFSASVMLLFGIIYTFATRYLEGQITDSIQVQHYQLLNAYRENGSSGVEQRIRELIASDDEGSEIYLLINRDGERLAGNLEAWPRYGVSEGSFEKTGEWLRFAIEGTRASPEPIAVRAITMPLSKWRSLLVGQSMLSKQRLQQTVLQAFLASLLFTVVIALAGALVITRSVVRRINIINRSAQAIMHGDLSARIPHAAEGDEFDDLSGNLNQMLDTIEALLQSLKEFAANIAHDLRSPLNRIISRTEAGLRGVKETSAVRKLLESNVAEMEGLIATFNSILKISELEANTAFRAFERCDIAPLLRTLTDFYEPYAAEKHIALIGEAPAHVWVEGERNLLTQAFANLVDNAIKFTPPGGEVRVRAEVAEDGRAVVSVSDNGPGIPAEYHARVFEKFFRLEFSRNTKGNGLGLSLVAAVARIHNARVTLSDNRPGLCVRMEFARVNG
jgi:signal transduction histidine kinase